MLGRAAAGVAVAVGAGEGPEGDVSPEPPQAVPRAPANIANPRLF